MKIINSLISIITVVFMLSSNIFIVLAEESEKEYIFDLHSLGIIQGDESGNLNLDKPLTRAEFCAIVARLQDVEAIVGSAPDCGFSDVTDSHWAKKHIDYLTSNGTINGVGDGLFDPEGYLTWQSASKILVNILGYGNLAVESGGYPTGYALQADRLGILKGVDLSTDPLPREEAFKMVYNTLDIDLMVRLYSSEVEYEIQRGNTFRNSLISDAEFEKRTGVVTASIDTWTDAPIPNMTDYELCVDGVLYRITNPDLRKYIGQEVDFYVSGNNPNYMTIMTMTPTERNNVVHINVSDLDSVDSAEISWYAGNDSEKNLSMKWDISTVIIKNNEPVEYFGEGSFSLLKSGLLTLIDNDEDRRAEVIIIKEPTDVIIEEVRAQNNKILFKDGNTLYGKSYFETEPSDDEAYITLTDSDGNNIGITELESGDVISGFENSTLHRYELVLGKDDVVGKISEVSDDGIVIDNNFYHASENVLNSDECAAGVYVRAYVNYLNEIIHLTEEISEKNYGYIAVVGQLNQFENPRARVLLPDTLEERIEEEENESGGESTKISKIFGRNKAVSEFEILPGVKIDGQKTNGSFESIKSALEGKVVIYTLNSENKISRIEFPEEVDTGSVRDGSIDVSGDKTYNSYEMTFGKTASGAFGVSEKTHTICVPKDDNSPSVDDYLVGVEMKNGREYTVKAFDKNEDTLTADLIVIQAEMKSGNSGIINSASKVGLVENTSLTLDENGDEVHKITLLSDGEKLVYTVSKYINNAEGFKNIKIGELIRYSTDLEGRLDAYESLTLGEGLSKSTPTGIINGYTENETLCGYLADVSYSEVSNSLNRWVHTLYCSSQPSGKISRELSIYKYSGPDIIIYDSKIETAYFGDIKDINLNSDKLFISITNSSVNTIVVIR